MNSKCLTILPDQIIKKHSELLSSEIDNEIVMMNVENGKYYGLNTIGSEIWKLLSSPKKVDEIYSYLLSIYNVEKSICKNEVTQFLNHLVKENLIEIQN